MNLRTRGGGSKNPNILRTSYMEAPERNECYEPLILTMLFRIFIHCNMSLGSKPRSLAHNKGMTKWNKVNKHIQF